MNIVRLAEAPTYEPPGHVAMHCLRLQGREAGPTDLLLVNLCHLLPGGSTGRSASPGEKVYVVLEGRVTITNGQDTVELGPWDSCRIAAGEPRQVDNQTDERATVLLVMPEPISPPSGSGL